MPNMNVDLKPALTARFCSHAEHLLCSLDPAFVHISKTENITLVLEIRRSNVVVKIRGR